MENTSSANLKSTSKPASACEWAKTYLGSESQIKANIVGKLGTLAAGVKSFWSVQRRLPLPSCKRKMISEGGSLVKFESSN